MRRSKNNILLAHLLMTSILCLGSIGPVFAEACTNMQVPNTHTSGWGGNRTCKGCNAYHRGWDLLPINGKATAAITGTITIAWERNQTAQGGNGGYGNVAYITSPDGRFRVKYAHAGSLDPSLNGTTIQAGTQFGDWTKCTGTCHTGGPDGPTCFAPPEPFCSYGMHLHMATEVKQPDGSWKIVDPQVIEDMTRSGQCIGSPGFAESAFAENTSRHKRVDAAWGGGSTVFLDGSCIASGADED